MIHVTLTMLPHVTCLLQEKVLTQGADAYDAWLHIRAPLYLKVYVFNLTNADEVAAGSDRLVVKEIGPYVFQDHRDKIIYDDDGKTITYMPKSRFEFIPEMTEGNLTLSDLITTVNIPLVVS